MLNELFTTYYLALEVDCYARSYYGMSRWGIVENLVGRHFRIDETDYAIVDVRNIKGDTLIYAEPSAQSAGPGRAAFRYVDIESKLDAAAPEVA